MMPSDLSDFNLYGGIYRYVNLVYTPTLSFKSVQTDTSVDEAGSIGSLSIKSIFNNYSDIADAKVNVKIFSPDNKLIVDKNVVISDF